ncbi:DNA replication complex GINS protein PSF3 [Paragonimus skrjabini miyazakii]|uniref:DNA replication complex GINS protein PSF3 n=1 Tax=Paragonimus skrjabini miyazakii TaxID=59628 RepID=A0A8S9Z1M2_9TREM|nr:DNA replication complex GINS protein PSF3 [Paragonimus skrjabini miyazakii]
MHRECSSVTGRSLKKLSPEEYHAALKTPKFDQNSRQPSFIDFDYTLSLTHAGAYLNLDDIVASSERTSCRLRVTLPGLAPLLLSDTTTGSANQTHEAADSEDIENRVQLDVPAGSKLELPVWLAVALGSGRRQLLAVDVPLIYKDAFAEVFDADPCVVDLRRKAPYYYMLLCTLLNLEISKVGQIADTAARVFQIRMRYVMNAALNASRQDTLFSTSKLDNLEMALFRIGQSDRLRIERWTARHEDKIEPAAQLKSLLAQPQSKRIRSLVEPNLSDIS